MIVDLASQAYNALRHNRRRSVLTMLGMAWGIATVVLLARLRYRVSSVACGWRSALSERIWFSSSRDEPNCRRVEPKLALR